MLDALLLMHCSNSLDLRVSCTLRKKEAALVTQRCGSSFFPVYLWLSLYTLLPSLFLSQGSSFNSKEVTVYLSLSTVVTVWYLPSLA